MKKLLKDILITAVIQFGTVLTIFLCSVPGDDLVPARFFVGMAMLCLFTASIVETFHSAIRNERG